MAVPIFIIALLLDQSFLLLYFLFNHNLPFLQYTFHSSTVSVQIKLIHSSLIKWFSPHHCNFCFLMDQNFLFTSKDEDSSLKAIDFGLSDFVKPGLYFISVYFLKEYYCLHVWVSLDKYFLWYLQMKS